MAKFEYIKWYWDYIDDKTPVLLFYEVDLENERYATRMCEVFSDKTVQPIIWDDWEFVTEAPVPTLEEINQEPEFYAVLISKEEFDRVYREKTYLESIAFPK